jgi:hypothetical protein
LQPVECGDFGENPDIVVRHFYSEREVPMNANQMNTGRGYWLAWLLASAMGYGMGAILGASFAWSFFASPTGGFDAVNGTALGLVAGATGGYFQWIVLRERIVGAGLWGLVSALGLGLAMGASAAADPAENPAMAGLVIAAIFGTASGILQWLILRRKVPRAGWWLPANLLGSLVAAIALPIAAAMGDADNWGPGVMAFGLVFGAGNGAITGAALIWLLHQSPSGDVEGLATVH